MQVGLGRRHALERGIGGNGRRAQVGLARGHLRGDVLGAAGGDVLVGVLVVHGLGELHVQPGALAHQPEQLHGKADLACAGCLLVGLAVERRGHHKRASLGRGRALGRLLAAGLRRGGLVGRAAGESGQAGGQRDGEGQREHSGTRSAKGRAERHAAGAGGEGQIGHGAPRFRDRAFCEAARDGKRPGRNARPLSRASAWLVASYHSCPEDGRIIPERPAASSPEGEFQRK